MSLITKNISFHKYYTHCVCYGFGKPSANESSQLLTDRELLRQLSQRSPAAGLQHGGEVAAAAAPRVRTHHRLLVRVLRPLVFVFVFVLIVVAVAIATLRSVALLLDTFLVARSSEPEQQPLRNGQNNNLLFD